MEAALVAAVAALAAAMGALATAIAALTRAVRADTHTRLISDRMHRAEEDLRRMQRPPASPPGA